MYRKSLLSLLMVFVLLLSSLPFTAHAETSRIAEGYDRTIYWHVDTVPEHDGDWRLTIEPRTPGTSVAMPDYDLTKDYCSSASWCDKTNTLWVKLYEIVITDGITHIGDFAFAPNATYTNRLHSGDLVLKLPDSVTSIGEGSFYRTGLGTVEWSKKLTSIGAKAFYYNSSLYSLKDMPTSVKSIGEQAFSFCLRLENVSLGRNITDIPDETFSQCAALSDVYYAGTPDEFNAITVGDNNQSLVSSNVHVPMSGAVTTTVTEGIDVGKKLTCTRMGPAGKLNAVNYRWERSVDKQNWTTIGKSNSYTIQKEDSEQYIRVCIYNSTTTLDGRTFYVDGTLYSTALKMPEFPICEIRVVLNISKDVDVKIWRRVYINGEQQHRYDGTIADGSDKKYTWIPGLYKGNYTLELVPASTYVPRTYEIEVKGNEWLDAELYKYGDINGDGATTVTDYNLAKSHMKEIETLTGYELQCADVVGDDGAVTITDVNAIRAHFKEVELLY